MGTSIVDFDKAIRFYQDNDEDEAVRIIDQILGIAGLELNDALEELKKWPKDVGNPCSLMPSKVLADGNILFNKTSGVEADLREYGIYGLIDLLGFRSKCLSAIMYGGPNKPKSEFIQLAVDNAVLVTIVLPEVEVEHIANVWSVAAQAPIVSRFDGHVEIALYMLHKVLSNHVHMRSDPTILIIINSVLAGRMKAIPDGHNANEYWKDIMTMVGVIK